MQDPGHGMFAGCHGGAQLLELSSPFGEHSEEALLERGVGGYAAIRVTDELEAQRILGEREGWWRRSGAVLDPE
jgi:hypothetical protein